MEHIMFDRHECGGGEAAGCCAGDGDGAGGCGGCGEQNKKAIQEEIVQNVFSSRRMWRMRRMR